MRDLSDFLTPVPDFPKPGIVFRDICPLLADAEIGKDAAQGALTLADKLWKPDRKTAKGLAEAVKTANLSPELVKKAEDLLGRK